MAININSRCSLVGELSNACQTKDLSTVQTAIQKGAQPDSRTFTWACASGNVAIVDEVLDVDAQPDADTLSTACSTGILSIVEKAITGGSKPDSLTMSIAINSQNKRIIAAIQRLCPETVFTKKEEWSQSLEKMLINRNPLQAQILNPDQVYGPCKGNIFIKNVIDQPYISIGDFTYAHMEYLEGENVLRSLVPYSFGDKKLIIGKFCSIGFGAQFISPYANHQVNALTTYPFWHIFSTQETIKPWLEEADLKGDTVIGNDVWFGREAMIMPGIQIGDGAIIAARAVVTQDVPPYAIVGGNPARIIRYRFPDDVIQKLLETQWWNWDLEKIAKHHSILMGGDVTRLPNDSVI